MAKKGKQMQSVPLQIRIAPALKRLFQRAEEANRRSLSDWARLRLEEAAQRELVGK
jgi:uncharacterized protein (DUF1778 family)